MPSPFFVPIISAREASVVILVTGIPVRQHLVDESFEYPALPRIQQASSMGFICNIQSIPISNTLSRHLPLPNHPNHSTIVNFPPSLFLLHCKQILFSSSSPPSCCCVSRTKSRPYAVQIISKTSLYGQFATPARDAGPAPVARAIRQDGSRRMARLKPAGLGLIVGSIPILRDGGGRQP